MLTFERMMNPEDSTPERDDASKDGGRRRRATFAATAALVTLVVDALVLIYVVPWAHEEFDNPFMSAGYIITFFLVLANLVTALALVALVLHKDSYPSDRWI